MKKFTAAQPLKMTKSQSESNDIVWNTLNASGLNKEIEKEVVEFWTIKPKEKKKGTA